MPTPRSVGPVDPVDPVDVRLPYLPQLDGLRAVAVALVVIHHLLQPVEFGGWIGVTVFFVLSGYLITSLLRVEILRTGRIHLRRFSARRLLRLYPPLIFAVVVLAPVGLVLYPSTVQYIGSSGLALTYTTNIVATALNQWVGPWTHTWTLATEEQFYLLWPLALVLVTRLRWVLSALGPAVLAGGVLWACLPLVLPHAGPAAAYNPLLQGAPLLAGCGLALCGDLKRHCAPVLVATAGLLLLAASVVVGSDEMLRPAAAILATIGSIVFIGHLTARGDGPYVLALSARLPVTIGKLSYEIYLWHYPLLVLLGPLIEPRPVIAVTVVTASLAMSFLSQRAISGPIVSLLKPKLERVPA